MAIIKQRGLQLRVATISDRNNITKKPEHLVVHVDDAIADPLAGVGPAIYKWTEASGGKWLLLTSGAEKTISFETKELVITNGVVSAPNLPLNNFIWDIQLLQNDVVIAYPRIEDLNINLGLISGLDAYNGGKLRFTYAYGSIASQLQTALDTKSNLYELNIDPLTIIGNNVKAGDFWHDITVPGKVSICLTISNTLIWMEI